MKAKARSSPRDGLEFARSALLGTCAALALLGATATAQAKDAIATAIVDVDGGGFPVFVTENGQGLTPGTYAIGTIMVDYFVTGYQFPANWQGQFRMCLDSVAASGGRATEYPANVHVKKVGTSGPTVSGVPASVSFAGVNDDPSFLSDDPKCLGAVVSVPASIAGDPAFQADGTAIVANLQESTDVGEHLDTPTTVKVRVTLVHPTACIRAVHLVSNDDFTVDESATGIDVNIKKSTKVLASQPVHMQHLLALVNTCAVDDTVDVTAAVNENFDVFHANGIRTTTVGEEVADGEELLLAGLDWDDLDNVNPAVMCLLNVTVPAHESFIFTQRVSVADSGDFPGSYASSLGRDLGAWQYGGFTYAMNPSNGSSTTCPVFGNSTAFEEDEISVPVNSVTTIGQGGTTESAP